MQFTVQKADLLRELQLVQGVVEKKTTVPILSNVLLRATRSGLEILATDMEIGIQLACEATVAEQGAVTIHARKLYDIVRALPDAEIKVQLQKANRVQIRCGKSEFKIAGQGTEQYPTFREYDFKGSITVPFSLIAGMIERVSFAIAEDDPRYAIHGALFIVQKGAIEMVATDGHRLAYIKQAADVSPKEEIRVIVPTKMLMEILKLEAGPEGEIRIGLKDNHIFAKSGLRIVESSLFDGTFPNYERVIPTANTKRARCPATTLLDALRRVSLLSVERTKGIKLAVEEGKMLVSGSNPEFGEAEESVEIEGFEGAGFEIAFNARFLIDYLQVLGNGEVVFELKDGDTQTLLRPPEEPGVEYKYVVMPLRL